MAETTVRKEALKPKGRGLRPLLIGAGIGLGITFLVLILQGVGVFETLELKTYDLRCLLRGSRDPQAPVVIVAVDDESLTRTQTRWPWPRSYHARLLDKLKQAGAKVVAFDVVISENSTPRQDALLFEANKRFGRTIWASKFSSTREKEYVTETLDLPLPPLRGEKENQFGFANVPPDSDGYSRRLIPFREHQEKVYGSLALKAWELYTGKSFLAEMGDKSFLHLDQISIALDEYNSFLINFAGPPRTFKTVSYYQVLEDFVPPPTFKDKIVLVGATAPILHDVFFTPYFNSLFERSRQQTPGVEVQANVLETFFSGQPIQRAGGGLNLLILFFLGLLSGIAAERLKPWQSWVLAAILLGGYFVFSFYLLSSKLLWVNLVAPSVVIPLSMGSVILYRITFEEKEKRMIKSMFMRYVSPQVVEEIIQNPLSWSLGGKRTKLAILFTDIRGFTTMSEGLQPEQVVDILNDYFAIMSEVIFKHRGTLDKYIGDAIMAFWGAPIYNPDSSLRAVLAGIEMQEKLAQLKEIWRQKGEPTFDMGVGVNTGEAVVGNIGSVKRSNYTIIGDHVNLASRLESLNKQYQSKIIVSQNTYDEVKDYIEVQPLEMVAVKGKTEKVMIYSVLGLKPEHRGLIEKM